MSNQSPEITEEELPLSVELLDLYDEFVDLHSNCAFLFDAVACMVKGNTEIDPVAIEGLSSLSWQARRKAEQLKEAFKHLHQKSRKLEELCKTLH